MNEVEQCKDCHQSCIWSNTLRLVLLWAVWGYGVGHHWWTPEWWFVPFALMWVVTSECDDDG